MRPELYVPRVLVLAGRRSGVVDPLASDAGVTHKCLAPVAGEAMIGRTLKTVDRAFPEAVVYVSIDAGDEILAEPTVRRLADAGRLRIVGAEENLVDSVVAAGKAAGYPLLITTADNVLVTVEALHALAHAGNSGYADAIAVFARREAIEAAHSGGKNKYYEFRDGSFSNCNLFWLQNSQAVRAAEAFRHGGQFLKVKGRLLKTFGLLNLVRFKLGIYSLEKSLRFASARLGADIRPLVLPDGRLAIDVDDRKSLRIVEEILERESIGGKSAGREERRNDRE